MKKFCTACGQDMSYAIKEGDILQCKRTGRLAVMQVDQHYGFLDVVLLTGDRKGRSSIWKREDVDIVHGYFHINRRVK